MSRLSSTSLPDRRRTARRPGSWLGIAAFRCLRRLGLPAVLLIALLQRTPLLRAVVGASERLGASPIVALLRSALASAATMGAMHTLAGATQFETTDPGPITGTVGEPIPSYGFTVTGATGGPPGSYRLFGQLPPGVNLIGMNSNNVLNAPSGTISGTPTAAGSYSISLMAYQFNNATGDTFGPLDVQFEITGAANAPPAIVTQPSTATVAHDSGSTATFTIAVTGSPAPTIQWQHNGDDLPGETNATLSVFNPQPENAGVYRAVVTNAEGTVSSDGAILGLTIAGQVTAGGLLVGENIVHQNKNIFDQVLLQGTAASVRADPGQILRMSYIDANDDIVQVEFSGGGTLTLVLDPNSASGPAFPIKYNQEVLYRKGHATIVIAESNASTYLSVFSVGRVTAVNQALFQDVEYDGLADIALIAITSTNGQFADLLCSNTSLFATKGLTGVYAPGVSFGKFFVSDVEAVASGTATPVLRIGSGVDTRITGGDLFQGNGRAVQVSGLTQLKFTAGVTSHGAPLSAKPNQGQLEENGENVTDAIVVNP